MIQMMEQTLKLAQYGLRECIRRKIVYFVDQIECWCMQYLNRSYWWKLLR